MNAANGVLPAQSGAPHFIPTSRQQTRTRANARQRPTITTVLHTFCEPSGHLSTLSSTGGFLTIKGDNAIAPLEYRAIESADNHEQNPIDARLACNPSPRSNSRRDCIGFGAVAMARLCATIIPASYSDGAVTEGT